jgi:hypothetical protein
MRKADRDAFERRQSKSEGANLAGLEFDEHLAGPGGVDIVLFALPDTPKEQIGQAKEQARRTRDVVDFHVVEIEPAWLEAERLVPPAAPAATGWLEAVRWIVAHGQARRIDVETGALVPEGKSGGMLLDLFSASAMAQVYDALNETNKAKLLSKPLPVAHATVFGVLNRK